MKLNKILVVAGIVGLVFCSCENEFKNDVELGVNVAVEDGISFDGQTVTVKKGTPVTFQLSGDPDFLSFYSGEAGHEYRYKDRVMVASDDIKSSVLKFSLLPQYGKGSIQLLVANSDAFPGLNGSSSSTSRSMYMQDSVLVTETTQWQPLSKRFVMGGGAGADDEAVSKETAYEIDMTPYLGQRIAIAIRYEGHDDWATTAQSKFTFKNMQIENQILDVDQPAVFAAESFGFTALNLLYCDPDFLSGTGNSAVGGRRRTAVANKPYGTATNNTEGVWNVKDWAAFFIHSSGANQGPKISSWLISNLMVVNACTPDSGTQLKNISQSLDSYTHTYTEAGTYTATFVATNANHTGESRVTREYTVVVTE